ncbi:hypothetical protein SELMODRAFT_428877 [Selaginella moellendorffii]|uniref:Uncharacterized protein n=1 Tax=Selaginella moellendorffii TaxID=88036 RepID=D8T4A5_SELML|nr:hypothetical protein SELMODRAFT_428877 [Selaginella moellendorffii]
MPLRIKRPRSDMSLLLALHRVNVRSSIKSRTSLAWTFAEKKLTEAMFQVRAAEAVTTTKLLLLDEQDRKLNSTASMTNLNGVHVSLDSPKVPGTPRIMEHNNSGSSSSSSHGNGMNEAVLTLEDMQQFQRTMRVKLFIHFLTMMLRTNTTKIFGADGNGHNLPESPFASPHHSENSSNSHIPEEHHDQPPSLSIEDKMMGLDLNEVFNLTPLHNDIICCICLTLRRAIQTGLQPYLLRAVYPEVIKGSKDECPICQQHIC